MTSVGVLVGWCLGPLFLIMLLDELFRWRLFREGPVPLLIASPIMVVPLTEYDDLGMRDTSAWGSMLINFFWYGAIMVAMRAVCYLNADRWLGRVRGMDHDAQSFVAVEPMAGQTRENPAERESDHGIPLDPNPSLTHNRIVRTDQLAEVDGPPSRDASTPPPLPPDSDQSKDHAP